MNLEEYFRQVKGTGILATASDEGVVNAAVFSTPHIIEDGVIAFLMNDHLSHENLKVNDNAAYMFLEETDAWQGIRLHLRKIREERNTELARQLVRRNNRPPEAANLNLVFFKIDQILPLIGDTFI